MPSKESNPVVIAAGLRTPWARAGGAFQKEDAAHLGARVARELIARTGVDPAEFDEVIAGSVGPPHDQANVGRILALRAGVPWQVPARSVQRNCASGLEAVTTAIASIRAGEGELYLCVGVEVMSAYPLLMGPRITSMFARLARAKSLGARLAALSSFRPSFLSPRIALVEGLTDPTTGLVMGRTAELLARDFGLSRADLDAYACESHRRAHAARARGRLAAEIMPHLALGAREGGHALDADDSIRDEQSPEKLGKLRPYFERPDGVVTVGNSCGVTDGACALIITREARARELGLEPLARVRGYAYAGLDPARMGLGPVFATAKVCEQTGTALSDFGAVELNEAFAAQVLGCCRAWESDAFAREHFGVAKAFGTVDPSRLNPNGGAIALGHPIGATGARLILTAAHELRAGDHELTLATLCIGGGQGAAVVLERCAA